MSARLTSPVGTPRPYRITPSTHPVVDDQQGERAERRPRHRSEERRDADVLDVGVEVRVLEPALQPLVLELQRPRPELGCLIEEVPDGSEHVPRDLDGSDRRWRERHSRASCHKTRNQGRTPEPFSLAAPEVPHTGWSARSQVPAPSEPPAALPSAPRRSSDSPGGWAGWVVTPRYLVRAEHRVSKR